ncbi:hypothetical protein B5X24_HaOG210167 [Helicoverpa armigera]|uniref:Uncharacterized protein n=1 Tax=Helicoverpa armigera TaxID=29058 RepID=A0A2W1BDQ1_HELAM|nr:hypothetical protein B5X24_HaOG210167 [Helicoverpa armigera]
MAAKLFCLFALLAVAAVASADNDCNCEPLSELENSALWEFFTKLSKEADPNDKTNQDLHAVLPGELSPLLDCNCLEKNRKKRRILPESAEEAKEIADFLDEADDSLVGLRTPKCPQGRVWMGIMCVDEKYVSDK